MNKDRNAEWWRGAAIYQIYPRSFQDTTGDGVGDLAGATLRLPYVASLGVDAIWVSPFFKSPMADMGYDVADYCDVDPMFGTLADFDALVAEAHRLKLKVIIDQVLSHSSDRHPWFMESRSSRDNPRADWYVWADPKPDGTPPNNWLSVFGGSAWEWDTTRKQYYLHNFLASQPDLNFHEPPVREALLRSMRFWLERGVDGFRVDAVNFNFHDRKLRDNPPFPRGKTNDIPDTNPYGYQEHVHDKTQPENLGFLKEMRRLLDSFPERVAMGEVGDGERSLRTVAEYTSGSDKLHLCYTFDLLSPEFSPAHIRKCVADFEAEAKGGWVCWAFSNHDVQRHVTRFAKAGDDLDRLAKFTATLLAALRGTICLYQGEELGLGEAELTFEELRDPYGIRFWPGFKGRDGCRTPMVWDSQAAAGGFTTGVPWLPVRPAHLARAVDRQQGKLGSVLEHYRATLAFRAASRVLRLGSIESVETSSPAVLAFVRKLGEEKLLCVFNFARQALEWPLESPAEAVIEVPGFRPRMGGSSLLLEGLDAAFIRLR